MSAERKVQPLLKVTKAAKGLKVTKRADIEGVKPLSFVIRGKTEETPQGWRIQTPDGRRQWIAKEINGMIPDWAEKEFAHAE